MAGTKKALIPLERDPSYQALANFLAKHNLVSVAATLHSQDIDLELLLSRTLTEDDFAKAGLNLGTRKKLMQVLDGAGPRLTPPAPQQATMQQATVQQNVVVNNTNQCQNCGGSGQLTSVTHTMLGSPAAGLCCLEIKATPDPPGYKGTCCCGDEQQYKACCTSCEKRIQRPCPACHGRGH